MKLSIEEKMDLERLAESAVRDPHAFLSSFNMNPYGIAKLTKLAKGTLKLLEGPISK